MYILGGIAKSPPQVSGKKQRDTAAADAEMKAKQAQSENATKEAEEIGPADILAQEDDEDVIF